MPKRLNEPVACAVLGEPYVIRCSNSWPTSERWVAKTGEPSFEAQRTAVLNEQPGWTAVTGRPGVWMDERWLCFDEQWVVLDVVVRLPGAGMHVVAKTVVQSLSSS